MTEDIPIPELPAAKIWAEPDFGNRSYAEIRRMAAYVREASAHVLSIEPSDEILRKSPAELFALAVRAQRAGLDLDVVASFLVFAVERGSVLAAAALAQVIGRRLVDVSRLEGELAGQRKLLRVLRQVEKRLSRQPLVEKFDEFREEVDTAGDAVRAGQIRGAFRRAGVDGTDHRVIAPGLKSLKHLETGDEFMVLMEPLWLWKSPVPPDVLSTVLAIEFPHLVSIADEIARFVAGGPKHSIRPILLVGPTAIGKDSILRRAAELVGRPFAEFDVAGSSDSRIVKGTSKGWSTASPGYVATICARTRCANPLIVFSELDRAGGGRRNGQVNEAFLSLCEPTSRRNWFDDGLGTELDLTDVALAFTSNSTDDTPDPLLTRLRILRLERPTAEQVPAILRQARHRLAVELKVPVDSIPEPVPEVIKRLEALAREGRFHLRMADRIVRVLGEPRPKTPLI